MRSCFTHRGRTGRPVITHSTAALTQLLTAQGAAALKLNCNWVSCWGRHLQATALLSTTPSTKYMSLQILFLEYSRESIWPPNHPGCPGNVLSMRCWRPSWTRPKTANLPPYHSDTLVVFRFVPMFLITKSASMNGEITRIFRWKSELYSTKCSKSLFCSMCELFFWY